MREPHEALAFGVEGLDKLFGGSIPPTHYLIVIAGHPGAGKTILASTICYANTLRGHKCLYISFQEDKDKLFNFMEKLGLNLRNAESMNLFKFVKLPISFDIESVAMMLNKLLSSNKFDILVVDSINALLEVTRDDASKRSWLQNFFYSLPQVFNGLVILIAEVPYGLEKLELGGIEFIADAVLLLKHRVEEGFLTRVLEVRKIRGVPVTLAEIPFSITEGKGFEVWLPTVLEEIGREGGKLHLPCNLLRKTLDHIHRGQVINIVYPADCECPDSLMFALGIVIQNDLRTMFISYRNPPESIRESIVGRLIIQGIESSAAEKIVDKYVVFRSLNPFSYSISQLTARELSLINSEEFDVVVFHGIEIPRHAVEPSQHIRELYNEMNYLRKRGKLVIRIGAYTNRLSYSLECGVSDALMRFKCLNSKMGEVNYRAFIWRKNKKPYIASSEEISECINEVIELIKTRLTK
ncbi:MAG: ATPase domain-containing protein [Desulfurococcaceae archaeon]